MSRLFEEHLQAHATVHGFTRHHLVLKKILNCKIKAFQKGKVSILKPEHWASRTPSRYIKSFVITEGSFRD